MLIGRVRTAGRLGPDSFVKEHWRWPWVPVGLPAAGDQGSAGFVGRDNTGGAPARWVGAERGEGKDEGGRLKDESRQVSHQWPMNDE